jgi:hypothetical protein
LIDEEPSFTSQARFVLSGYWDYCFAMFDHAEGTTLAILIAAFIAAQLVVAWAVRQWLPRDDRWMLLLLPLVFAPLIPSFPIVLVILWTALSIIAAARALSAE